MERYFYGRDPEEEEEAEEEEPVGYPRPYPDPDWASDRSESTDEEWLMVTHCINLFICVKICFSY